jgi:ketosteroid isomerase-like protein
MGRHGKERGDVAARIECSRRLYAAVNDGDIDAAISLMCPDVDWANALEGGWARGHDEVRRYWERITVSLALELTPLRIEADSAGRIVADTHQMIRDRDGKPLAHHQLRHIFTFRGDLIRRLDIREPPLPPAS